MTTAHLARTIQRRINAAIRRGLFPPYVLQRMARMLHAHRAHGTESDVNWFLGEFGDLIRGELKSANRMHPKGESK